jgi:hypothetical protein
MNNLITGLFEEYRIVQNKIDKIADFEFKVRGWCITLESALIFGLISDKIPNISLFYLIGLMIFIVLVFQFLEQEQLETRKILSKRALIVEQALDRLLVSRSETILKKEKINQGVFESLRGCPRLGVNLENSTRNRTFNSFKNMFKWKNHVFYYAQYIIILMLIGIAIFGKFHFGKTTIITNLKVNDFSWQDYKLR